MKDVREKLTHRDTLSFLLPLELSKKHLSGCPSFLLAFKESILELFLSTPTSSSSFSSFFSASKLILAGSPEANDRVTSLNVIACHLSLLLT